MKNILLLVTRTILPTIALGDSSLIVVLSKKVLILEVLVSNRYYVKYAVQAFQILLTHTCMFDFIRLATDA